MGLHSKSSVWTLVCHITWHLIALSFTLFRRSFFRAILLLFWIHNTDDTGQIIFHINVNIHLKSYIQLPLLESSLFQLGVAREAWDVFDQVSAPLREEAVFQLQCFIPNWRPFHFLSLLIILSRVLSLCCNHGLQFGTLYSFFLVNPGKGDYQSWARHFYLTVIRHHDQGHLRKRKFNLVYGSRGKEAWQQAEGTAIIPWSCKLMSWPTKNRAERSTASKVRLRALKAPSHSLLQMTHSFSKAISCRTPEAWPPTHNQTFKSEPMVGILM